MEIDNIQIAIWLEYAETSISRAREKAKNPQVKRALDEELSTLKRYIDELKRKPTPIEAEILKKKGA